VFAVAATGTVSLARAVSASYFTAAAGAASFAGSVIRALRDVVFTVRATAANWTAREPDTTSWSVAARAVQWVAGLLPGRWTGKDRPASWRAQDSDE
jgi:hypothetical protein